MPHKTNAKKKPFSKNDMEMIENAMHNVREKTTMNEQLVQSVRRQPRTVVPLFFTIPNKDFLLCEEWLSFSLIDIYGVNS